jgi:thiamine biosynthesis lipoprotein
MIRGARLAAAGVVVACGAAPPSTPPDVEVGGEVFGAGWRVRAAAPAGLSEAEVRRVAEEVFAEVDRGVSTWRADSDIGRCRASTEPVAVSDTTAAVVRLALDVAARTGGAFDPTVQPLVELWGVHGARRTVAPTEAEVVAARAQVGFGRVSLSEREGVWWLGCGGTALDLSAIAPGYAADRVSDALAARGVASSLVDVGGEVRVRGRGPSGAGWRLGIDLPEPGLAPGEALAGVVTVADRGVATSGNYRNRYVLEGQEVVHELDPRTGRPALVGVASATVVAPTAALADAWATALMVLGEPGLAVVAREAGVDALLLVPTPEGFAERATPGMSAWRR